MTPETDPPRKMNAVRAFWADQPMTYGFAHGDLEYRAPDGSMRTVPFGTREFFETSDETFYAWNPAQHNTSGWFGNLFDYDMYRRKHVLEIGCGMGCMAMNWAQHGALITAVDLNPVAVEQTKRRFELYDLQGDIREADARTLPFADNSFDYAYSWGVLHHSPDLPRSLAELRRVLRPGSRFGVMLYHRNSLLFRYMVQWIQGVVNMENRFLNPLELASRYGDGQREEGNPHTWPVTRRECRKQLFQNFEHVRIQTFGTEMPDILDYLWRKLGQRLPQGVARALQGRWGWSLWITGRKAD